MLKCLIALIAFLPTAALAQTVWTWVDEEGRRHYSDTEVAGATAIVVEDVQTFSSPAPVSVPQSASSGDSAAAPAYSTLEILSPAAEETIRNIEGNLAVEIGTFPQLRANHFIDVILDGRRQYMNARSLDVTVEEVYRGTHTLQAVIVDISDEILIQSDPVTIYVQQASALPQPGQFPAPGRAPTPTPLPARGGD